MIVPALTSTEASRYLEERFAERECAPSFHESGFGTREVWQTGQAALRTALRTLWGEYRSLHAGEAGPTFDSVAAVTLHRALRLDDRAAASDGFWRFLACTEMFETTCWRHGREGARPNLAHFGLGDRWECLPRRLWFRGELSRDQTRGDAYELTVRGGRDFWASGLLRVLYPSSRSVARALVAFQFPSEGMFKRGEYRPQTLTLEGVRELYKRLRHFNATIALATLDDNAAGALVQSLAEGLARQATDASEAP